MELSDDLKQLMKELGVAINEALTDSETIAEAISNIRIAGYDVLLVLEATIGVQSRETDDSSSDETKTTSVNGELMLTNQDTQFLKSLKITLAGSSDDPRKS